MEIKKADIVIIGAGLTGLTLAHYLHKTGKKIFVLEKQNHTGGVIQTHNIDGFTFESGPNTGVASNPEVAELFEDLYKDCTIEIANPKAKSRWIWKKEKWNPLPSGLISGIKTPLFTLKDKFRILGEPFRKKGDDPNESVAGLVKRRLGKSFLNYAVDPFIGGIYAGDPELLITKYALPKLYALENNYGSFIKGSFKKMKEPKPDRDKKATKEVFSATGGLNNLILSLEKSVGKENIFLNEENIKTIYQNNIFKISLGNNRLIETGKLITTCGGYALPKILSFISEKRFTPVIGLKYAKIVQVILCYKNWKGIPLNAFGGLVPSVEKRNVLGILFTSSFFKNRCPDHGSVLSVFIGGIKRPEMIEKDDDEIKSIVLSEVTKMLNPKTDPDIIKIFRHEQAIPQYDKTSKERLERIEELENEFPGLILAGNIRDGIGMADRIKQAYTIAEQLK